MANPNNRDDHDSPWKEALELYFYQAIKLLAPPLYDLIDPSVPPVFLDKELQSLLIPDPDTAAGHGRLYADKLVQTRQRSNGQATGDMLAYGKKVSSSPAAGSKACIQY